MFEVKISSTGYDTLIKELEVIEESLTSPEFMEFIGNKAMKLLQEITLENLSYATQEELDTSYYYSEHKLKIEGNKIILYNNSEVNIETKNMSEETKAHYIGGLSLAKIVEYGIGYTGAINTEILPDSGEWAYDVNNHGYKGWYFKDWQGNVFWTNGFEGKLIFYKLKQQIEVKISSWIKEYIDRKTKN
jgi:hypothetical protein